MASTGRKEQLRAALRRRPFYYGFSTVVLLAAVGVLTLAHAPKLLVVGFVVALWAGLMYLLRWRGRG